MRFGHHSHSLALLCLSLALSSMAAAGATDGWKLIWQNQQGQARAAFTATLAQHPNDTRALFGLAMLDDAEGDEIGALQAWRRYDQLAPANWPAMAYWPRVVELAESTGRYALLDAIAGALLAAKSAPAELRASARLELAEAQARAGHLPVAEQALAPMGYLRNWRIIGPFDNVSKSGFAKAFPPEREIDYTRSYTGLNEQSLGWHPLLLVSRDGHAEDRHLSRRRT